MNNRQTVLVVDDSDFIHTLIASRLRDLDLNMLKATDGPSALGIARHTRPDLILLDVTLPGADGFQICRELKQDPITREIGVIFLTGSDSVEDKIAVFEV